MLQGANSDGAVGTDLGVGSGGYDLEDCGAVGQARARQTCRTA